MSADATAWQAIAIRWPGDRKWRLLREAPITPAEALHMVEEGEAITAQRRERDGTMTLLYRPILRRPR